MSTKNQQNQKTVFQLPQNLKDRLWELLWTVIAAIAVAIIDAYFPSVSKWAISALGLSIKLMFPRQ